MSKSFLQSSEWAKFQESVGHKTFRVENKLVIKNDLPLGLSYLYSPRPDFSSDEILKKFLHESAKLAKSENSIFLRFEPDLFDNLDLKHYLEIGNWKLEIARSVQPQDTLILDLSQSEDDLLAQMHQKTRYNIRLAEKHDIRIKKSTNPKDIDIFYNLAIKTAERDNFRYHSRNYYKKMIEILGENKMVELYIAYHEKNPVAATLILFYGNSAIYLHGASDHNFRNLMAPYLLQWHAIKDAKNNGCKTYDFWGVAPQVIDNSQQSTFNQNHPWAGVTRFKLGFAPENKIAHYPDCYEIVYQPFLYQIYKIARKVL